MFTPIKKCMYKIFSTDLKNIRVIGTTDIIFAVFFAFVSKASESSFIKSSRRIICHNPNYSFEEVANLSKRKRKHLLPSDVNFYSVVL